VWQVQEALMRLSPEERQLLEWHFGEEASEREIAKRVGRSKTWVHKQTGSYCREVAQLFAGQF
jgi:DNA-directed RNA polymerase specialized sigma24 family protein